MTKQQKILVGVAALAAIGGLLLLTKQKKAKSVLVSEIIALGGLSTVSASDLNKMNTYEDGYLKSWLAGLKANQQTFDYNGKTFFTKGGTAVK